MRVNLLLLVSVTASKDRLQLKMNLNQLINTNSNPLVRDDNRPSRQNLPKIIPFNQETLIEKSR